MENKETIVQINGIIEKTSKAGKKYFSVQTNEGIMSCFDEPIVAQIKANVGKSVKIEIAIDETKGFKNIRKFIEVSSQNAIKEESVYKENGWLAEARAEKNKSMYVAYAKDLCIELMKADTGRTEEDCMLWAIKMIKTAIDSF